MLLEKIISELEVPLVLECVSYPILSPFAPLGGLNPLEGIGEDGKGVLIYKQATRYFN